MSDKKPGLISRLFGVRKQKTVTESFSHYFTSDDAKGTETDAQKKKRMNRLFSVDASTFRDRDEVYAKEFDKPESDTAVNKKSSSCKENKAQRPTSASSKNGTAPGPEEHSQKIQQDDGKYDAKSSISKCQSNTQSSKNGDHHDKTHGTRTSRCGNDSEAATKVNVTRRKSAGAALSRSPGSSSSAKDVTSQIKPVRKSSSKSSSKDPTSPSTKSPTRSSTTSSGQSPTSLGQTPPVFDEVNPLASDASTHAKDASAKDTSPGKARRSSTKPKLSNTRKSSLPSSISTGEEKPFKIQPGTAERPGSNAARRPSKPNKARLTRALRRKKADKGSGAGTAGGVQVDITKPLSYPATPETIYEYHRQKPFLDRNEEWLIVELNEYECLVDSIDIIKIIAKHSKFFEVEPDELWAEFFEFVEEVPSYDEIINYDVWQEFRDHRYPC